MHRIKFAAGVVWITLALICLCHPAQAEQRTERVTLNSEQLKETRTVFVSLPDSYRHSERRYPVLFTTDAELIHEYAYGASLYLSRQGQIPEIIVVGIVNTDREKNLYHDVDDFLRFLTEELVPLIDRDYRSNGLRALYGFSSGTVPVHQLLFGGSPVFKLYIAAGWGMSDAGYERLKTSLASYRFSGQTAFLSTEGLTVRRKNVARFLADLNAAPPRDFRWHGRIYEDLNHADVMTRGLYDGLEAVFDDWRLPAEEAERGLAGLTTHEAMLSDRYGSAMRLQSASIAGATQALLGSDKSQDRQAAIGLLEESVRRKPWDPGMVAYLAYAHWQFGDQAAALNGIRDAIELAEKVADPRLPEYRGMLRGWEDGR